MSAKDDESEIVSLSRDSLFCQQVWMYGNEGLMMEPTSNLEWTEWRQHISGTSSSINGSLTNYFWHLTIRGIYEEIPQKNCAKNVHILHELNYSWLRF